MLTLIPIFASKYACVILIALLVGFAGLKGTKNAPRLRSHLIFHVTPHSIGIVIGGKSYVVLLEKNCDTQSQLSHGKIFAYALMSTFFVVSIKSPARNAIASIIGG